jgi:SMI1 / KNR4 family (SUKH-1)
VIESDIAAVETRLGPLPGEFRRFLSVVTPAEWRAFPGVLYGVGSLLKENTRIRRRPAAYKVIQPDGTAAERPADWLAIADNGGGDHWFVRAEDAGRAVWFWSHESWEARPVASTIADLLTKTPRPTETILHPTLGPVEFNGSSYHIPGPLPVYVQVGWLQVDPAAQCEVLEAAALLIPEALAGERGVLEAALPQLVELQHEPMWWCPDAVPLTAAQLRERLTRPSVNVHAERETGTPRLNFDFLYEGGEPFGWDMVDIATGPLLEVRDVRRLG